MNVADVITSLSLPADALVERRIPKKLLLENGAITAADKRYINDEIEELLWVAALKPTTIGVSEYHNAEREYLEIAVLWLTVRAETKVGRLIELVHRAVPYPLLLLTEYAGQVSFSTVHKRWAQNEAEKTVLDGEIAAVEWEVEGDDAYLPEFCSALALERQPHVNLRVLYQGWMDTIFAFKAARLTGSFKLVINAEHAIARQMALRECAKLETEMASLRAAAAKEKQMARKVELNIELKHLEAAHALALAKL